MNKMVILLLVVAGFLCTSEAGAKGKKRATVQKEGWELIWHDEFNGG